MHPRLPSRFALPFVSFLVAACGARGDLLVGDLPPNVQPDADAGSPPPVPPAEAGPADAPGADAPNPIAVAYVASNSGGIQGFRIDPISGALAPLPGSTTPPGGSFYGMAIHPSGAFAYAVDFDAGSIDSYRIGPGGALGALPASPTPTGGQPTTIALDPQGRFAYVGSYGDSSIHTYRVDPMSGALMPASVLLLPHGTHPMNLATELSGRFLYLSQISIGIRGFAVDESGALTELPGSPFQTTRARNAGAIVMHPGGRFLVHGGGSLNVFAIDAATGALETVAGSPFSDDVASDPQAIDVALHPRGTFVYAIHASTGHLSAYAMDPGTGSLTPVPGSPFDAGASPYSVALDRAGRFVFVANDLASVVAAFSVDPATGAAIPVVGSPFTGVGLGPEIVTALAPAR